MNGGRRNPVPPPAHEPAPQAVTDRLAVFGDDIRTLALEKSRQETEEARPEATALVDHLTAELAQARAHIVSLEEQLTAAGKDNLAVTMERDEARREMAGLREQLASVRGELQAVTRCHQEIVSAIRQNTTPAPGPTAFSDSHCHTGDEVRLQGDAR